MPMGIRFRAAGGAHFNLALSATRSLGEGLLGTAPYRWNSKIVTISTADHQPTSVTCLPALCGTAVMESFKR